MYRLYVNDALSSSKLIGLNEAQKHYLIRVLRLSNGSEIAVFNGCDGEWRALLQQRDKKNWAIELTELLRSQQEGEEGELDIYFCFALIKQARLDYMVQKAVELGASALYAVNSAYSQLKITKDSKLALRLKANIIEAAEQCQRMVIPKFAHFASLEELLHSWPRERLLLFCDEKEQNQQVLPLLNKVKEHKLALLIGPEGGFSHKERQLLRSYDFVRGLTLGPFILRSDTASLAMLALINAVKYGRS